jgi:hypothetical protein
MSDRASEALAEAFLPGEPRTYDAISKRSKVPLSTLHHRAHGRRSKEQKAQSQQYLTPSKEKALKKFLILMSDLENPVQIKSQSQKWRGWPKRQSHGRAPVARMI